MSRRRLKKNNLWPNKKNNIYGQWLHVIFSEVYEIVKNDENFSGDTGDIILAYESFFNFFRKCIDSGYFPIFTIPSFGKFLPISTGIRKHLDKFTGTDHELVRKVSIAMKSFLTYKHNEIVYGRKRYYRKSKRQDTGHESSGKKECGDQKTPNITKEGVEPVFFEGLKLLEKRNITTVAVSPCRRLRNSCDIPLPYYGDKR